MTTETIDLEVVAPEQKKELLAVVEQNQIGDDTALSLQRSFAPLFKNARCVIEKSRTITVTDASQKVEIKVAREYRLALKNIRVESDKKRRALKEESLRMGRAIDGFHAILLSFTQAEETRLQEQEDFVARQEAVRKAQLKLDREKALAPFGIDTAFYNLADMTDQGFAQLLENTQAAHVVKQEQAQKAEEERIRLENERLREQQRMMQENARLKKEREEQEAAAKAERERLEAIAAKEREKARAAAEQARKEKEAAEAEHQRKLGEERKVAAEKQRQADEASRKEREARKRLEQEKRDREAAEEKKRQEEAEAAERAAAAPDRVKFIALAAAILKLDVPKASSRKGKLLRMAITEKVRELATWVADEAESLGNK